MIQATFSDDFYKSLTEDQRNQVTVTGADEDKVHDYSHDDVWIDLKYKATRAYKKLKQREHKLRQ